MSKEIVTTNPQLGTPHLVPSAPAFHPYADPIAIVGMGCLYADADHPEQLWQAVLQNRSASREVPANRWVLPPTRAYDPAPAQLDRVYSRRACLIEPELLQLNRLRHWLHQADGNIDRTFVELWPQLDPTVHVALHAGLAAWLDTQWAGLERQRVGLILGHIALPTDRTAQLSWQLLGEQFVARLRHPSRLEANSTSAFASVQTHPWNRAACTLPAWVLSTALRLGGVVYTLDAACASSLYALYLGMRELQLGRADAMLVGGLSRPDCLYTQMGFSQLRALAADGICRPFDREAGGLVVGEGGGIVVLKRLADARNASDRIYGLIRGIGLANDVAGNLLAPDSAGQLRAMHQAYEMAGWQPQFVDLIECHATGTPVGDAVEWQSLLRLWAETPGNRDQQAVLSSVKSNVGHTLTAAGASGLIKVLLACRDRCLPPIANFTQPQSKIELTNSPFRILREPEPWPDPPAKQPRRAALSGFGFGGINAHVLIEAAPDEPGWIPAAATLAPKWIAAEPVSAGISDSLAEPQFAIVAMNAAAGPYTSVNQLTQPLFNLAAGTEQLDNSIKEVHRAATSTKSTAPRWWGLAPSSFGKAAADVAAIRRWPVQPSAVTLPVAEFRIPPTELREMLPQQALLLKVAGPAWQSAWYKPDGIRIGVFVGVTLDLNTTNFHLRWALPEQVRQWNENWQLGLTASELEHWCAALLPTIGPALTADRTMGALASIAASRLARSFRLGGPSYTISAEEASGLQALQVALDHLQRGDIDAAVVGAVDLAHEPRSWWADATRRHETFDPKCFAQPAPCFVAGPLRNLASVPIDAAAVLIVKRLADALQAGDTILAVGTLDQPETLKVSPTSLPALQTDPVATNLAEPISLEAAVGYAGAASGLLALVAATLAVHQREIPGTPATYWLRNRADGPRTAHFTTYGKLGKWWHGKVCETPVAPKLTAASGPIPVRKANVPKLAFVYPGSGNHYVGMGREICRLFPHLVERQDQENRRLRDQLRPDILWHRSIDKIHQCRREILLAQVAFGTLITDLLRDFGLYPDAVIGYSLGESASLFGMRAWTARDEMLQRLQSSPLFTTELGPPYYAARAAWNWPADRPIDWVTGIVPVAPDRVRAALVAFPHAYLLIINTSDECVIGGLREEVLACVRQLQTVFLEVPGVTIAHCPVNRQVAAPYRALHALPTTAPAAVQFYSGATGLPYIPTEDFAADAILGMATATVDFVRVVMNAYQDGIRTFVEIGPGTSCTRMIRKILGARPHLAIAAVGQGYEGRGPIETMLNALSHAGYSIDWSPLPPVTTHTAIPSSCAGPTVAVQIDETPIHPPLPAGWSSTRWTERQRQLSEPNTHFEVVSVNPVTQSEPSPESPHPTEVPLVSWHQGNESRPEQLPIASSRFQAPVPVGTSITQTPAQSAVVSALRSMQQQMQATHDVYLQWMQQSAQLIDRVLHLPVLSSVPGAVSLLPADPHNVTDFPVNEPIASSNGLANTNFEAAPVAARHPSATVAFPRSFCLEFARGQITPVLGPEFALIDSYPTRVRLPDEPLMLVDRILSVTGKPRSLGTGQVVTEHDIHPNAWFLDNGVIPTSIAVESGQADLFLSAWLGIDFITKGLAVYRLLDAAITFHRPMPGAGTTIRYDITIERFFQQGNTYLFRFRFDATVAGELLLTMRDGCAGFFTPEQLAAGKGLVFPKQKPNATPSPARDAAQPLAPLPTAAEQYDAIQLAALRSGDLVGCFGPAFAGLNLQAPLTIPGGRMRLLDRVTKLDLTGGAFGLGWVSAELDIHPDDWFLTCHFVDDQVMPGTLMYECCLHTCRVLLLRFGWVGERAGVVCQPLEQVPAKLRCRGQVTAQTKTVGYEVTIKQLGYTDAGTPYAIADAIMLADGRPIVEMLSMSARFTGWTKAELLERWRNRAVGSPQQPTGAISAKPQIPVLTTRMAEPEIVEPPAPANIPTVHYNRRPAVYDRERILAYAVGNPSAGFGTPYQIFDETAVPARILARLPGPPYLYVDRIVEVEGAPWQMQAGAAALAEYDVPPQAWYFAANNQPTMPFAVLLEIALQPCGWLAAYVGSALTSPVDLSFRNLGGTATQHAIVHPTVGTLTTAVRLTKVSSSGGMIIQHFDFKVTAADQEIYTGNTYFGFFSKEALANQVGIRDGKSYQPSEAELRQGAPGQFANPTAAVSQAMAPPIAAMTRSCPQRLFGDGYGVYFGQDLESGRVTEMTYPATVQTGAATTTLGPYPVTPLRMLDDILCWTPTGGPAGLGFARARKRINPAEWFFQAHFYQDPVWPGSLGLEAFLQLLRTLAGHTWGIRGTSDEAGWEKRAGFLNPILAKEHSWTYRGQVLPTDQEVIVDAVLTERDDQLYFWRADGTLTVDGRLIYRMTNFTLQYYPATQPSRVMSFG